MASIGALWRWMDSWGHYGLKSCKLVSAADSGETSDYWTHEMSSLVALLLLTKDVLWRQAVESATALAEWASAHSPGFATPTGTQVGLGMEPGQCRQLWSRDVPSFWDVSPKATNSLCTLWKCLLLSSDWLPSFDTQGVTPGMSVRCWREYKQADWSRLPCPPPRNFRTRGRKRINTNEFPFECNIIC